MGETGYIENDIDRLDQTMIYYIILCSTGGLYGPNCFILVESNIGIWAFASIANMFMQSAQWPVWATESCQQNIVQYTISHACVIIVNRSSNFWNIYDYREAHNAPYVRALGSSAPT